MGAEIKWQRRFRTFERAYLLLRKDLSASVASMSDLEKAGIIQHFEILFELSWKILKEYLEYQGVRVSLPRDVIKKAFQSGLIQNGEDWMESLKQRNKTTHIYNEEVFHEVLEFIQLKFYPIAQDLHAVLKSKL